MKKLYHGGIKGLKVGTLENDPDCIELGLSYQCDAAIIKDIIAEFVQL